MKFADKHKFKKPNDGAALELMAKCASIVMEDFKDIIISYGQSDEFSFIFSRETEIFQRRSSKIMSSVVSLFSTSYVYNWSKYFADTHLLYPPCFDGRTILYPSFENVRDYLSWRQADCHINNLHNTCFWKLVLESNYTHCDAQTKLGKMVSSDKNELLFKEYDTNYNNIPELFRKGTVLIREQKIKSNKANPILTDSLSNSENLSQIHDKCKGKNPISILNIDIIGDKFWNDRNYLLYKL